LELNALRFGGTNQDLAEAVAHDNNADDEVLQRYIDDAQLEAWFQGAKDTAKDAAMEIAEMASKDFAELQQFSNQIKEPEFKRIAEGDLMRLRERHAEMDRDYAEAVNGYGDDTAIGGEEYDEDGEEDGLGDVQADRRNFPEDAGAQNGFDEDGDVEMS
jgi:hypothetical protein